MSETTHTLATGNLNPQHDEISLLDLLQVGLDNLKLLILVPLLVGLTALSISFFITPIFTATTRILPPQQSQSSAAAMLQNLGALGGLAGAAAGIKNPNDQYVALLRSDTVAFALVDRFKLADRYRSELRSDARQSLEGSREIAAGKDGLISVSVDDPDPVFAAELANAHIEEFRKLLSRLAVTEAQQRRQFFETQLSQTRDKLATAELALRKTGIDASVLKSNPETAVRAVAELQAQVVASEVKVSSMLGYLAPTAPELRLAQQELAALRAQLAKIERSTQVTTNSTEADYVVRYRDFKYYETLFELFAKQFELAKVDEAREGAMVQIVDTAMPPERKSRPRKAVIAVVSTLGAGICMLLFVFLRQAIRNASKDPLTADKLRKLRVHSAKP